MPKPTLTDVERHLLRARVHAGLARARASGVKAELRRSA